MRPVAFAASCAAMGFLLATSAVRADIAIGTVGPMSGSLAIFGAQMMVGAEQAVADINAAGGLLGEKLVLEVADDKCDRKQAGAVANQMIGRDVVLVVGHLCAGASMVAAPIYHDAGIVQISPGARAAKFTDERPGPGTFRICGREDEQGRIAGEYLANRFADSRIAIVHDNSPYGIDLAEATLKAMNLAGKRETFYEARPASDRDFTALFARLSADGVDVLFYAGYHSEAAQIVRRMREEGIGAKFISGDALMTEEFIAIAGEAGIGSLMTYPPDPARNATAPAVVERLAAKGIVADGYVLYAYAAVEAWAAAVEAAGTIAFDAVATALSEGQFDTVLGHVAFDAKGDVTLPAYVVYEWRNGEYGYAPM